MKNITLLTLLTALIALAPLAGAQMIPTNDRVRVEVSITTDTDHKNLAKTSTDQVTQNKALNIALTGKPKSPETRVIKWTAYGRNMKSNNVSAVESGEIKLDLVNGRQTAESKRFSTTYTPEHSVVSNSRSRSRGSRSTPRAKKVEASGVKFAGYSVQVLDGGKVVGEASDPSNIGKPKP